MEKLAYVAGSQYVLVQCNTLPKANINKKTILKKIESKKITIYAFLTYING